MTAKKSGPRKQAEAYSASWLGRQHPAEHGAYARLAGYSNRALSSFRWAQYLLGDRVEVHVGQVSEIDWVVGREHGAKQIDAGQRNIQQRLQQAVAGEQIGR